MIKIKQSSKNIQLAFILRRLSFDGSHNTLWLIVIKEILKIVHHCESKIISVEWCILTSKMLKCEKKKKRIICLGYSLSPQNDSFIVGKVTFPREKMIRFLLTENLSYFLVERCHRYSIMGMVLLTTKWGTVSFLVISTELLNTHQPTPIKHAWDAVVISNLGASEPVFLLVSPPRQEGS